MFLRPHLIWFVFVVGVLFSIRETEALTVVKTAGELYNLFRERQNEYRCFATLHGLADGPNFRQFSSRRREAPPASHVRVVGYHQNIGIAPLFDYAHIPGIPIVRPMSRGAITKLRRERDVLDRRSRTENCFSAALWFDNPAAVPTILSPKDFALRLSTGFVELGYHDVLKFGDLATVVDFGVSPNRAERFIHAFRILYNNRYGTMAWHKPSRFFRHRRKVEYIEDILDVYASTASLATKVYRRKWQ